MFRRLLLGISCLLGISASVLAQSGTLKGKIIDKDTKEPIPFANVAIEAGGKILTGATSDFDGNYTIKPISPGRYDVKALYVGFKTVIISGVLIKGDQITFQNIEMQSTVETLDVVEVFKYKVPLIDKDQTTSGGTITEEEIKKMPGRSIASFATTVGGVFSDVDGAMGGIRGQRSSGTVTYIDGVKVTGSTNIPRESIEQVSVLTGGVPAKYGDATGGVINVTTKGPSREFGFGGGVVTSQFLDNQGYNLLEFNVQGPLIMGKDKSKSTSLLGFFISGELLSVEDGSPSIGTYRVKKDILEKLENEPLRPSETGSGNYLNSEFIRKNDLEKLKTNEYAWSRRGIITGKIDVRLAGNTNLTFGGNYINSYGLIWSRSNSLFNTKNNGSNNYTSWRTFGRFTQRFPTERESKTLIKNAYYTIQADYSKNTSKSMDPNHKDNLFNYGYVGKFTTTRMPAFELGIDTIFDKTYPAWLYTGDATVLYEFERSDINPELANYTQQYYNQYPLYSGVYQNRDFVRIGNGLLNGDAPPSVYGLWANTGTVYNDYSIASSSQLGINVNVSADVGNHEVKFGFQYEQRTYRSIQYNNPRKLWELMYQLTNKHIEQLDKAHPHPVYDAAGVFQDTIYYDKIYDKNSQSFFDYNLRKKLGLAIDGLDWIDVESYDPETFSIDMFSADELFNNGQNSYVSYYGYDYTGKILKKKPSFEDFFTEKDEFGNKTRPIGAFQPIYMAGYIQDKFDFRDLIFRVGLRIDRFDLNQPVLKDPYLLYEAKTVKEVTDGWAKHPSNMGTDYVVYVNTSDDPSAIVGYRDGDTWYNAEGTEISDPEEDIKGEPYLVDPKQTEISSNVFKDYEPQITVMPRIAFSFPISDEALFYAHYDVLTQRPTSGTRFDISDYYFFHSRGGGLISNPNLKPEKTVEYELGFHQKLTNTSSLRLSAYYREMRNQVQTYKFVKAYPATYTSYNNIDFGTIKGLTITYDLRKTGNIRIRTSYTLQFADGTGSSASSGINLLNSGQPNLRTIFPLNQDRRHAISMSVDYRYGSGKRYNGPRINKKVKSPDGEVKVKPILLLENTGINVTFSGGSGVPYSRQSNYTSLTGGGSPLLQGSINGSRLPWQFRIDVRVDRDIALKYGKGEGKKKTAFLNIYLEVLNVLNTKNITAVYRATGNPDDDGFLSAAEFQTQINSQIDPQSYRDLYSIRVDSPYNYSLPRRVRLGITFSL